MVGPARLPPLDRDPPSTYMRPILPRRRQCQIPAKRTAPSAHRDGLPGRCGDLIGRRFPAWDGVADDDLIGAHALGGVDLHTVAGANPAASCVSPAMRDARLGVLSPCYSSPGTP